MAVIKDYYNGLCRIIVYNEEVRTAQETEEIIERISKFVLQETLYTYLEQSNIQNIQEIQED